MTHQRIHIICACDHNYGIGHQGRIPWRLSADLRQFSRKTAGKAMIMGRHTFESLPFVLPGRDHVVITSDPARHADLKKSDRVHIVDSYSHAVQMAQALSDEVYVIGGQRVYAEALPSANTLSLTMVHGVYTCDTRFPASLHDLTHLGYEVHSSQFVPRSANDEKAFTVLEFVRLT